MSELHALGLTRWPFSPIPSGEDALVWAGRPELRHQVDRLLTSWRLDDSNSLYLIWATWGAGKTHFLYFLRQQVEAVSEFVSAAAYCEAPSGSFHFLDLYRQIVRSLPIGKFLEPVACKLATRLNDLGMPSIDRRLDVEKALWYMATDAGGKGHIASRWLQSASGVTQKELNSAGITCPVKGTSDAASVLAALCNLLSDCSEASTRLLLLLDEYQRVGALSPARRNEISDGLLTLFNSSRRGVKIFLSLRSGDYDNVRIIVPPALVSRANREAFKIDELSGQLGVTFVAELLSQVRPPGNWEAYYPFTHDTVEGVLADLQSVGPVTPRRVLQCLGYILSTANSARQISTSQPISLGEMRAIISSPDYDAVRTDVED